MTNLEGKYINCINSNDSGISIVFQCCVVGAIFIVPIIIPSSYIVVTLKIPGIILVLTFPIDFSEYETVVCSIIDSNIASESATMTIK